MDAIKKRELVEIIRKLAEGNCEEEQISELIECLEKETDSVNISDYIFWDKDELTPDEILEKALKDKPIRL